MKKHSLEDFVNTSNHIHGDKYDYSLVNYINRRTKVKIICPKHGVFEQVPGNHIHSKQGCILCRNEKHADNITYTIENFQTLSNKIHDGKYDVLSKIRNDNITMLSLRCPEHGVFEQRASDHITNKAGCRKCNVSGFDVNKPGMLYYLRIGDLFKIGITNLNVKKRFGRYVKDLKLIEIVKTWNYQSGQNAYDMERYIIKHFEKFKYRGDPVLIGGGNTELFTKDILQLVLKDVHANRLR